MAVFRTTPYSTPSKSSRIANAIGKTSAAGEKSDHSLWDILKNMALASGIYLFYSGWVYLYFFLKEFGISIHNVDIQFASYYIYGYLVFSDPWNFLALLAGVVVLSALYYFRERLGRAYTGLLIVILLLIFPLLFRLSRSKGLENARMPFTRGAKADKAVPVYFNFKKTTLDDMERPGTGASDRVSKTDVRHSRILRERNTNGQLFLLFESETAYYVYANPNTDGTVKKDIEIYLVNKSDINYSTIYSQFSP